MGATAPGGIIKRVPYGLLRNVNLGLQPVSIVLIDDGGNPRDQIIALNQLNAGVPFYTGETIKLIYRAPSQSSGAQVCDLWKVNPTTGAESLDSSVSLSAVRQKAVIILISAINGSTGALTKSVSYEV